MAENLMRAHAQWMNRPDDERFTSLPSMAAKLDAVWKRSKGLVVPSRALVATATAPTDATDRGLVVTGPGGNAVDVTHWSFGQLAQRAGAPASYLRTLPPALVADCVNVGLAQRPVDDIGVFLRGPEDGQALPTLAAVTGPGYGRVSNSAVVHALIARFGDGVTGHFKVPGIRGQALAEVTQENTTLYASDRDIFVFLADEDRRIEVPNRRDGQPGTLARGFFVWNSEVGSSTFGVATFLFDFVCQNRIVWGADEYKEIRIRHTSGAPERWIREVAPALERYAASSDASVTRALEAARAAKVGDEDAVRKLLEDRFTRTQAAAISTAHMLEEGRPIETLWDVAVGVSAYAKGVTYQDERVKLEREAGALMSGK